jgi:DHA1 family multidrug resistance protein-like MFS transporter
VNWSIVYKCIISMMFVSMTFSVTFASSVFSTAIEVTARNYDVSTEVATLGVSLFVLVSSYLIYS